MSSPTPIVHYEDAQELDVGHHDNDDGRNDLDHRDCSLQLIEWSILDDDDEQDRRSETDGHHLLNWLTVKQQEPYRTIVGLTVTGTVDATAEEVVPDSALVVVLFTVESDSDSHWLQVEPHLPTVVNSKRVFESCKLPDYATGSLIIVGDRYIQLTCSHCHFPFNVDYVPPKPPRRRQSTTTSIPPAMSSSQSIDCQSSRAKTTVNTTELANYAASLVSSQLLMTSLSLKGSLLRDWRPPTRDHIDMLFNSFRESTTVHQNVELFLDFVTRCRHIRSELRPTNAVNKMSASFPTNSIRTVDEEARSSSLPKVTTSTAEDEVDMTDRVVELLTDLIRNTVDPLDHVVLWLELLADLAQFPVPSITKSFSRHRTTAVILGCMTAHARCSAVQRHACQFLSRLVANSTIGSPQLGVKENAVEMIADVMKRHSDDVDTVRAAVTALAVLTAALSRYAEKTIQFSVQFDDDARCNVSRAIDMLDCVYDVAYPTVVGSNNELGDRDSQIRYQTDVIMSFFSSPTSVSRSLVANSGHQTDNDRNAIELDAVAEKQSADLADGCCNAIEVSAADCDDIGSGYRRRCQSNENTVVATSVLSIADGDCQNENGACLERVDPNSESEAPTLSSEKTRQVAEAEASGSDKLTLKSATAVTSSSNNSIDRCETIVEEQAENSLDDAVSAQRRRRDRDIRRHGSLKDAVRSLLTHSGSKLRRQSSERQINASRSEKDEHLESNESNPEADTSPFGRRRIKQSSATAPVLDVGFRRSRSTQLFDPPSAVETSYSEPLSDNAACGEVNLDSNRIPLSASDFALPSTGVDRTETSNAESTSSLDKVSAVDGRKTGSLRRFASFSFSWSDSSRK